MLEPYYVLNLTIYGFMFWLEAHWVLADIDFESIKTRDEPILLQDYVMPNHYTHWANNGNGS